MVVHFVILAKLKLFSSSHGGCCSPIMGTLVCPFFLKLAFRFRFLRGAYLDVLQSTRLFFFQLGRIAFDSEPVLGHHHHHGNRFGRAIRLVCQRLTHVSRARFVETDEESLRTLSILVL